ncbi:MAG: ribose-5-phosphate isomerase RpiA [Verrucomicrobia bacterium]|nr:ribose-5-phosphate isomerase RpiA [Verrucomicrobiota bacterium]
MDLISLKQAAAEAALAYVPKGCLLGVGTGSTMMYFIRGLRKGWVRGAVPSSKGTEQALRRRGIRVLNLNQAKRVRLYVDGADEVDAKLRLTKGGGGALTREKIIATAAKKFICIVDESKLVKRLGKFPIPLEVVPMARDQVAKEIRRRGGRPVWRKNFMTDNGGEILDVHGWRVTDPVKKEKELEGIPGVICAGVFGKRRADLVLVGTPEGVKTIRSSR